MKNRLISLALAVIAGLTLLISALFIPLASAAVTTDAGQIASKALKACADNSHISSSQYDAYKNTPSGKACIAAFTTVYTHPDPNTANHVCDNKTATELAGCTIGRKLGGEVRTADEKSGGGSGSGGSNTPSDSTIAGYAQSACNIGSKPRKDSCIAGYIAGYKGSPSQDTACKNGASVAGYKVSSTKDCGNGYKSGAQDSGITHPTAQPGDGSGTAKDPTGNDQKQLSCDVEFTNPLTWVICPVIGILTSIVDTLDSMITSQLSIETDSIFCGSDICGAYYTAWQSFRNIALGLTAIAGLIVVISQALDFEIIDAYTVRKVLPRLLVAVVGISLSWQLMKLAIEVTNALGHGIRHLIYAPFSHIPDKLDLSFGGKGFDAIFGTAGAVALVPTAILGSIEFIGIILAYAGTAALAVFIAVLVLVLRQVLIIMLILMAPVAIITYVFPNTQRIYKLWWESFIKALMMFPLIAAFIAAGRVFSAIAVNSGGLLNQMVGFAAYFAPYFLIPATFKLAGGALRQIGGFVNDRSRGGFDRLRNYRANKLKDRGQALKEGRGFRPRAWMPKRMVSGVNAINEATKGLGTGLRGHFGLGERGFDARRRVDEEAAANAQKSPHMQGQAGWNDANRILAMGMGDEQEGRKRLRQHLLAETGDDGKSLWTPDEVDRKVNAAASAAWVAGGFTKANGIAAFQNMVQDGTAIRDTDDLAELAAIAGQGDKNLTYTLAARAASQSRGVSRSDLAAASEPIGALALSRSDEMFGHTGDERFVPGINHERASFEAWKSGAGGEIMYSKLSNAKARTIRNDTGRAVQVLKEHREDVEARKRAVASGMSEEDAAKAVPMRYTEDDVQFAAVLLADTKNGLENNVGKQNNRDVAWEQMGKDDGALDWYLDTKTAVRETVPELGPITHDSDGTPLTREVHRETTNREVVNKLVGDRYARTYGGASPEERALMEERAKPPEEPPPAPHA